MSYEWKGHTLGEWRHEATGERDPAYEYPPDAYVTFGPAKDGSPSSTTCLHYWSLYNGAMPEDDDSEDSDYLHICGVEGLDDLIASLTELRRKLYGEPS